MGISIGTLNLIEVTLMEDLLSNSIKDPDLSLFQGSASSSILSEESIDDFNSFSPEKNLNQLQFSQIPMESTEKKIDSNEPKEIAVNQNEDRNPRKKPMVSSVSDILPFKRRSQRIQKQRATVPIESNIKSTNESKKKKLSNQMMSFRGKALQSKIKRGRKALIKSWKEKSCGECNACLRPDCGQCTFCLNKTKFGGPGRIKQKCSKRGCQNMS